MLNAEGDDVDCDTAARIGASMRREPQTASHGALVGVALLCGLVLAVVNVEQPNNLVPPTARPPKRKIAVHDFEWYERAVAVKARATIRSFARNCR